MITVKTGGTDRELGATIYGRRYAQGAMTCYEAAQRLLSEIDGWPRATSAAQTFYGASPYLPNATFLSNPTDSGGVFLPNGGCAYIDLGHPEICTPECRSAAQYTASLQAMITLVQDAMRVANVLLEDNEELAVCVDNSDRQGNSYGAHLNVTVSRQLWQDIFRLRLFPHLSFLASFQASSIALTGGGKVGSEDGAPMVDFQLSRRADFIKTYVAEQTTYDRPLVNSRDEALGEEARLHCIFWDAVLLPAANYLQFGCLQLVTALMEAGTQWMPEALLLEAPIAALRNWSRDPGLTTTARLINGRHVTALQHQEMVLDQVARFVDTGIADEAVADAREIVAFWRETLGLLLRGDEDRASRRVEWLAKRRVLQAAMASRANLDWQSLEIRHLDLSFGDLNTNRGVYWSLLEANAIDQLSTTAEIARYKIHPPSDTRAQARTTLIRQLGENHIVSVDWAEVRLRNEGKIYSVHLPRPDHAVVALNDLTAELVEQSHQRYHSITPYIGNH